MINEIPGIAAALIVVLVIVRRFDRFVAVLPRR